MDRLVKSLRPYFKSGKMAILLVAILVIAIMVIVVIRGLNPKPSGKITESQIMIQRGDKVVIIDESGLIEYRTKGGVFFETWDGDRIRDFFESMRAKAREYLSNPNPQLCENGYTVTLYLDGREVEICVSVDDEDINEVFNKFPDEEEDSLDDIFDDYFSDDNGSTHTTTPTPTSTSAPTPTPEEGSGHENIESGLFDCTLYEHQVTGRTVISNTLCILEEILGD